MLTTFTDDWPTNPVGRVLPPGWRLASRTLPIAEENPTRPSHRDVIQKGVTEINGGSERLLCLNTVASLGNARIRRLALPSRSRA